MKSFPGTLTKQVVVIPHLTKKGKEGHYSALKYVLTDEQREWLFRWFPEVENSRLMKASGMSFSTLHRFAREYNLVKSKKGLLSIKRRQAAHIKRVCERNGYYERLRGKSPSEACRIAAAKFSQEVREGKRLHPIKQLKLDNPRRYNKIMKQRSADRKELIRKEKFRVKYGLPRQTRLRIPSVQYTRRQLCQRHYAYRRGYILMKDVSESSGERFNIYYDDDTQRGEIFEATLKKDGFKVKPYIDD